MKQTNARAGTTGLAALAALVSACGAAAPSADDPSGQWVTASRNLVVSIGACGPAMCARVMQVLANNSMLGKGQAAAATLPIGYRLITGLHRDGDHWSGRIFNREDGRTYDCTVRKLANGVLEVRPYIVAPVFGRTQIWPPAG